MFKDGIDFDALIEARPFNGSKVLYKYAMSDGGLVMVDVVHIDNSPVDLFMVPIGLSFKEKIFGLHTNPDNSYPAVKKLCVSCSTIRHFKTYPNQFPNLDEIRLKSKSPSSKEIDQVVIDLVSNNPGLINKGTKIIVDYSHKIFDIKDYASRLSNVKETPKENKSVKKDKIETGVSYIKTLGSSLNCYRLQEKLDIEKLEVNIKDMPATASRKKNPDYGFVLSKECESIKEIVLGEGLTSFDIASNVDYANFALEKITFPSTISVTNILFKLNLFKNLMLVLIKPSKKIQVKFSNLHYVIANVKKKQKDALFFTYNGGSTYGGITYVSHFKEDKLVYLNHGYYYLVETEEGKGYRLLKTDIVDTFEMVKEIKGIPVKYIDSDAFSNSKNHPAKKYAFIATDYYTNKEYEDIDMYGFAKENGLEIIKE